jgi:hypothetical protein
VYTRLYFFETDGACDDYQKKRRMPESAFEETLELIMKSRSAPPPPSFCYISSFLRD